MKLIRPIIHIRRKFLIPIVSVVIILLGFFIYTRSTLAATYTWDGGGDTATCGAGNENNWTCKQNWSSDIVPSSGDTVVFNNTSDKDSTIDATASATITILNINSGYDGIISMSRNMTISSTFSQSAGTLNLNSQFATVSGTFTQGGGTFNGGSGLLDANSSVTLNSGANFTAPNTGNMSIATNFSINSGASFTHNSGTITFDGNTDSTLSCGSKTFNLIVLTKGLYNAGVTVGSDCTIPLGNSPTIYAGPLTNNGAITIGSGTWTIYGNYTQSASTASLTFTGTTIDTNLWQSGSNGSITLTAGSFTATNLTTMTISGSLNNSGNLLPNNLSVTIDGNSGSTITCGNVTFGSFAISKGLYSADVTIGSDCNISLGNSPTTTAGTLTNNGTITIGTGTWTINGNYTQSASTASLTFGGTNIDANAQAGTSIGSFTLSAGSFSATNLTTMTISGSLNNSGNLLPNNLSVTIDGNSGSTITCGNVTFGSFAISKGLYSADVTIGSDCNISLGNSPTTTAGTLTNNGTITIGTGTWTSNGNYTQSASTASLTFGGTTITANAQAGTSIGSITLTAGSFTANSLTTINMQGNLTNTANLLPSGLVFTLSGGYAQTINPGNATMASLTINKTSATVKFSGNTTITGNLTRTDGQITNSDSAVTLNIQGNLSMSTTDAFGGANLTVKLSGPNTQTITRNAANTFSSPLVIDKSGGSASLSTTFPVTTENCTVVAGIFDINGQTFTCGGTFTIQDGGTLRMIGTETPTSPTLDPGSTVSFKGTGTGNTYTVTAFKTQYSNLSIDDVGTNTFQLGAALDVDRNLTINTGTFDISTGNYDLTIGGNFTNNATFNGRAGTVIFDDAGRVSVINGSASPAITFNSLTSTTAGKVLKFTAGKTFRINGLLTITGNGTNRIRITSSTPAQWFVNHQGTEAVTYAYISNSGCDASTTTISLDTTDISEANNGSCWGFSNLSEPVIKGDVIIKGDTVFQ